MQVALLLSRVAASEEQMLGERQILVREVSSLSSVHARIERIPATPRYGSSFRMTTFAKLAWLK